MDLGVPILCYHRVYPDDSPPPIGYVGEYFGHLTVSQFRRQMEYLAANGISTITHSELAQWMLEGTKIPSRSVAIDFDDAWIHLHKYAWPVMREFGFRGTIFVVSQLSEGNDIGEMSRRPYRAMNWDEIGSLAAEGWLIGAHTRTHAGLAELVIEPGGPEAVQSELIGSQEEIAGHLGVKPEHFAYPKGSWNQEVEALVKNVYLTSRLFIPRVPPCLNRLGDDVYRLVSNNIDQGISFADFKRIVNGVSVTDQSISKHTK